MLPLSDILEKINPLDKKEDDFSSEFYLVLVISPKKVKSGIWRLSSEEAKILSYGSLENWSGESAEELTVAADASIAVAIAQLSEAEGKQPAKIILGLPESWTEGNAIKGDKLAMLQKACRKLSFKPIGFVVTPEAIAFFLKKEEGGLPSAILVDIEETEVIVSLISQGKFLGSRTVGRSDSLALDLEEGLLQFNFDEILPSRILIMNNENKEELEEARQNLVSYPWVSPEIGKKLKFLQLPKVEIVDHNLELRASVLTGSKEISKSSKVSKEIELTERKEETETEDEIKPKKEIDGKEETTRNGVHMVVEEIAEEPKEEIVKEKDSIEIEENATKDQEELAEEDFGFIENEDILFFKKDLSLVENNETEENIVFEEENKEEIIKKGFFKNIPKINFKKPKILIKSSPKIVFSKFKEIFLKIGRLFSLSLKLSKKRFVFLPFVLLIFFFGTGFFVFANFSKANVKIFVQPQKIEKEFLFTVSSKVDEVDTEKLVIPLREETVKVNGEKEAAVTGKKTVGDKATGEVIIYNRTDQAKTFPKGTKILGPGGLKFILENEVKVASKTADLSAGVDRWGEAKVSVLADNIGAQYNLAAESVFSFEGIASTSFLIKNPKAFSGGTSREIRAVSKNDRDELQKALNEELGEKAKEQIAAKLSEKDQLLSDTLKIKGKVEKFSHEIDDEAEELSLEEEVTFSIQYFKKEDFDKLVDKIVFEMIPEGYEKKALRGEESFELKEKAKNLYKAKIKREFLPYIDINAVPLALRGKTFSQGENYLRKTENLVGIEITMSPKLFSKIRRFPLKTKNITLIVEAI